MFFNVPITGQTDPTTCPVPRTAVLRATSPVWGRSGTMFRSRTPGSVISRALSVSQLTIREPVSGYFHTNLEHDSTYFLSLAYCVSKVDSCRDCKSCKREYVCDLHHPSHNLVLWQTLGLRDKPVKIIARPSQTPNGPCHVITSAVVMGNTFLNSAVSLLIVRVSGSCSEIGELTGKRTKNGSTRAHADHFVEAEDILGGVFIPVSTSFCPKAARTVSNGDTTNRNFRCGQDSGISRSFRNAQQTF